MMMMVIIMMITIDDDQDDPGFAKGGLTGEHGLSARI